jgi:hypothetical protein
VSRMTPTGRPVVAGRDVEVGESGGSLAFGHVEQDVEGLLVVWVGGLRGLEALVFGGLQCHDGEQAAGVG